MTSFSIGGQSSGDFRETSGRVQLFHVVTRNSVGLLTPDAFTQSNPPTVTGASTVSTTLSSITKVGVLGGSVAMTRPDVGNNYHGGPNTASYAAGCKPLGIYLNDALGNAFENTPGVASGRGSYVHGTGSCVGLSVYETQVLLAFTSQAVLGSPATVVAGNAITYSVGDVVYASANGLITNVASDAYEFRVGTPNDNSALQVTPMGVVKVAPDANSSLLVVDLRV